MLILFLFLFLVFGGFGGYRWRNNEGPARDPLAIFLIIAAVLILCGGGGYYWHGGW